MKLLLLGANGQVGHELRSSLAPLGLLMLHFARLHDGTTWLILAGDDSLGDVLAAQLRERGGRCVVVRHGAESGDLDGLLERVRRDASWDVRGIVHLWTADASSSAPRAAEDLSRMLAAP